ncbi:hypothetical protein ACLOJK_018786 [Asimina triloba]
MQDHVITLMIQQLAATSSHGAQLQRPSHPTPKTAANIQTGQHLHNVIGSSKVPTATSKAAAVFFIGSSSLCLAAVQEGQQQDIIWAANFQLHPAAGQPNSLREISSNRVKGLCSNIGGEELGWERRGESSVLVVVWVVVLGGGWCKSVERRWNLVLSGRVGTVGESGEGSSVWGRELLEKESGLWQRWVQSGREAQRVKQANSGWTSKTGQAG